MKEEEPMENAFGGGGGRVRLLPFRVYWFFCYSQKEGQQFVLGESAGIR